MAIETYECILSGTLASQFVQTILHCNVNNTASTSPFTVAKSLLAEFVASGNLNDLYCNCLPADYVCTSIRVRRVLPSGGPTDIVLRGGLNTDTGQRSGFCQSASNSPMLIWITSLRPSKTGRTFMPGASIEDVEQMIITGTLITALIALADYWQNGGTLASPAYDWNGSILRRELNTADDIAAARVSPIIGTQRRRQRPI